MRRPRQLRSALLLGAMLCATSLVTLAESGILVVHVKNAQGRAVVGVQVGVTGDGGSAITDDYGKARIQLAKQTKENDWVSLQILHSPPGNDFKMVSPWDYGTFVPSFANESKNVVEIVVVESGDRAALEYGHVLKSFAEQINRANAPKSADAQAPPEDPKASLAAVAKQYGLAPNDVDQAIRTWKTNDPYEVGQKALYERNYSKASVQLAESLRQSEKKLLADQKAVADRAFFLGLSLLEEGKYREAASALQRCLELRPDDSTTLNDLGFSLTEAGDYAAAEPLSRRALEIKENTLGPDHREVASALNNLAMLLEDEGNYAKAEPLFQRALAINEKALGSDHPLVATSLNNLAEFLWHEGEYERAEPLAQRALSIDEKALGPDNLGIAPALNTLALLLQAKRDYAGAETLYQRELTIDEHALGPDHPNVATPLHNLASLLQAKKDYAGAEQLYRRALAIRERALGPNHPLVARTLNNLAFLLTTEGAYSAAEPLYRRALAIDEKTLGPNQPSVASDLNSIGSVLYATGNYVGAEPLARRALAIDEKTLGPDHPTTQLYRRNLESLNSKIAAQKPEKK